MRRYASFSTKRSIRINALVYTVQYPKQTDSVEGGRGYSSIAGGVCAMQQERTQRGVAFIATDMVGASRVLWEQI